MFPLFWALFHINYIFSLQGPHFQSSAPAHFTSFLNQPSDLQTLDITTLLVATETSTPLPPPSHQQQGGGVNQQGSQTLSPIPSTSSADNSSIQPTPPSIINTDEDLYSFLENALMFMH